MSEPSLDRFLGDLAEGGRWDSAGAFTIGWERAVTKLREFQVGDPAAFLLYFVSAGHALGARNISIEERQGLKVVMHGAYVTLEELRRGFQGIATAGGSDHLLDLALGLHGGLRYRGGQVNLRSSHPEQDSYSWTLTSEAEHSDQVVAESEEPSILATFGESKAGKTVVRRMWEKLWVGAKALPGGYVGMSEPCRIVDARCDYSHIPLRINSQMTTRPVMMPVCPIACKVGAVSERVRFQSRRVMTFPAHDWRAALVLQPGKVRPVVNGVAFEPFEHATLSGVAWLELSRDLSRSRLIKDDVYDGFLSNLDAVAQGMLAEEETFSG